MKSYLYILLIMMNITFASDIQNAFLEYDKGNKTNALKIFETVCQDGNVQGCVAAASMYNTGDGIKINKAKSKDYYSASCIYGNDEACFNLGHFLMNSEPKLAQYIYRKSCRDNKNKNSCFNLALMHLKGDRIKKDYNSALLLFQEGCKLGDNKSCDILNEVAKKSNTFKGNK